MTTAVDVDLASSILAMWQVVRQQLGAQRPQVGHIEEQARRAFDASAGHWQTLVIGAARNLSRDTDVAQSYVFQLGGVVNSVAAGGLAVGMDVLLGRGWNPEVAWQRVLAGYGLDARRLRGLLGGAMPTPNASGAGAAPDSLARTAVRTTLAYAKTLAHTEIAAWANVPDGIGKAYDPQERRDSDGKWTRGPAGRPVKVKEQELDPLAGIQIAEEKQEAAQEPQQTQEPPDRYASTRGQDRYASTRTAGRYTSTQDRYASVQDRYATTRQQLATAPDAAVDRYGSTKDRYATTRSGQKVFVALLKPIGAPQAEKLAGEHAPREGYRPGWYLPLSDAGGYFSDDGAELQDGFLGGDDGTPVDFAEASDSMFNTSSGDVLSATQADRAFGVSAPPSQFRHMADEDWERVLRYASPLWQMVVDDPGKYAASLSDQELAVVAERAGYGSSRDAGGLARDTIEENNAHRKMDPDADDGNLIEAMADYIVFSQPKPLYDEAQRRGEEDGMPLEEEVSELVTTIEGLNAGKALTHSPVPGVFHFESFHQGEKPHNLKGLYKVHRITYRSAIGDHVWHRDDAKGTFLTTAPPRQIGVREFTLTPKDL